jgi:hypothetical protein
MLWKQPQQISENNPKTLQIIKKFSKREIAEIPESKLKNKRVKKLLAHKMLKF